MEIHNITNCTRCGENHEQVEFTKLTNPIKVSGETPWTHWAPCPKTGEPILMKRVLVTEDSIRKSSMNPSVFP